MTITGAVNSHPASASPPRMPERGPRVREGADTAEAMRSAHDRFDVALDGVEDLLRIARLQTFE
jgi:hypothetical protein